MNTIEGATLIAPLVHMNGSSAETLIEGYTTAGHNLRQALDALYACRPNGRDYYPQGGTALIQAAREHDARIERVQQTLAEIEMLIENVVAQRDARSKS